MVARIQIGLGESRIASFECAIKQREQAGSKPASLSRE
jgi:hypothetical protein